MNEYCYKCGGVHPPMGTAGCPVQPIVRSFTDPRDAAIAGLREENARLREALEAIRIKLRGAARLMHYQIAPNRAIDEREARKLVDEALDLAAQAPEAKGKSGKATDTVEDRG